MSTARMDRARRIEPRSLLPLLLLTLAACGSSSASTPAPTPATTALLVTSTNAPRPYSDRLLSSALVP